MNNQQPNYNGAYSYPNQQQQQPQQSSQGYAQQPTTQPAAQQPYGQAGDQQQTDYQTQGYNNQPAANGHLNQSNGSQNGHSQAQQPYGAQPAVQPGQQQYAQQPAVQPGQQQQPGPNYSQPPANYVPNGGAAFNAMSPVSTPGMRQGYMGSQPAPQQPQKPAGVQRKKSERIDPKQIPRPVEPQSRTELIRYYTRSGALPPPSSAEYMAVDEGNCSPRFVRLTTYQMANEAELLDATKLCIGAVIQPLAALQPGEEAIHTVDPGPNGILRCDRCRAYVNPFFKFTDGGSKFKCNLCGTTSEVPAHYQCNLDGNGDRRDKMQRAELCRGTYEFVAGPDFVIRPIQEPHFLFVIDVSHTAAVTGLIMIALNSIRASLDALAENPRNKVGIMTFDHQLQFYTLNSDKMEPTMLVLPDVEEPFVPCPKDDIFVSVAEGREILDAVLDLIGTLYETRGGCAQNVFSASGCAVGAAAQALTGVGGKVLLVTANLCNTGAGKLSSRDDGSLYGGPKEHTLFQPQSDYYDDIAKKCAEEAITVDLFVCANQYVDLATIGVLSNITSGQLYLYPGFNANKDALALQRDVFRDVTRFTGFDGVMVVRCTAGLRVADYYGNFYRRQPGEMDLPTIDCDKSFGVRFEHEGALEDKSDASIQVALLYTNSMGERKIRVHNLAVPVTSAMASIFRFSDLDAIMNLSLKQAAGQLLRGVQYADAQAALCMACIDCLHVYRKNCASASSAGQLILPEPLKLLPLSTLGLIKHPLLQSNVSADQRSFMFSCVQSMPCYVSVSFTCPKLFCLTNMPEGCCVVNEMGRVFLPPNLNLSKESMQDNGIYILDNGTCIYMWIGEGMSDSLSFELFGVNTTGPQQSQPTILDNGDPMSLAGRALCLVETLRTDKPSFKNLQTISKASTKGDAQQKLGGRASMQTMDAMQFLSHLVEDAADSSGARLKKLSEVPRMSYIDFLCYIHKEIQKKFY